jgi:hypothetical protein
MGVMELREDVHGAALPREMRPSVPSVWRDGVTTWFGIESLQALPPVWCRDDALMRLVGFTAPHVRQGMGQRGAATRQGARTPGPLSPEPLANQIVTRNLPDPEPVGTGALRAWAQAGVFAKQGTGRAEGTDVATTDRDGGGGQVTRQGRLEDQQGRVHALEVTVDGWPVLRLLEALPTLPLAVKGAPIHEHEALGTRALVPHARMHLAGGARLPQVRCAQGFGDGPRRWWLDQPAVTCGVPATAAMAVTAEARAPAAAGEESTVGRRAHTARPGQGTTARTERLEPEVVGIAGLAPSDP